MWTTLETTVSFSSSGEKQAVEPSFPQYAECLPRTCASPGPAMDHDTPSYASLVSATTYAHYYALFVG